MYVPAFSGNPKATMPNFSIKFDSVHGPGSPAFHAEADAATEAHAARDVLEFCAESGTPLEYVRITHIADLLGARLDGLRLVGCILHGVNLSGVSLRGAQLKDVILENCIADGSTHLDDAILEQVRFRHGNLPGVVAPRLQAQALRFDTTIATGWNVEGAEFHGVRSTRSNLSGWKAHMANLCMFEGWAGLLATSDMTENQRAAVQTLMHNGGNRVGAQTYFDALEAQAVA